MKCYIGLGEPASNEEHLLVSESVLEMLKAGLRLDAGNNPIEGTPLWWIPSNAIPIYTSKTLAPADAFHVSARGQVTRLEVAKAVRA